ncbi:MAG: phage tail tape measure protein [Bacteroidales bacterium]|nr:phage tail tape measure protein [Bacteroidales bacterium]
MANIILNVDLNSSKAKMGLSELEKATQTIAKSLQEVSVNKNLTSQINATARYYNSIAKAAKEATIATEKRQAAQAKADLAAKKTATEQARRAKILEDNARAEVEHEKKIEAQREKTREATAKADLAEEKLTQTRNKGTEETKKSTEVNKKHEKGVLEMAAGFIKWQAAATLVMQPLQNLRSLVGDLNETLVETEKSVVSLTRVAGEEANSDEIFGLAQKYGQSFENVAEVVERFAKSGYDWRDSIKAAESALVSMNVAELDASQATEGVIAILKQFQLEIGELDTIIGILNKTADKYAVDTEELLIALQKTGSSAKNANLSLQETVGLITALSEGTAASGQNIGNALRSLFIFSSDKKALETFASLSDAMEETVRMYQAGGANILDVWRGLGNELSKLDNSKGMLSELFGGVDLDSDIASQLTQIEDQFAEIYGTAGNYRQNYFIALLDNIETATKAVEDMTDVESYSHKENELAMETYEKKLASLDAKWKELANDEQGILMFKKVLVDIGIETLDFIDIVGGLNTALLLGGTAASAIFGAKAIDGVKKFATWVKTAAASATSASIALTSVLGVLTAISVVFGVISRYYEELHERNQAAIDAANANREQLKTLEELEKKYDSLDKTSSEYKKTEQEIVSVLGDKGKALEYLKGDQDAYTDAIKKSIEALKEEYNLSMRIGFESAKSELQTHDVGNYGAFGESGLGLDPKSKRLVESVGLTAIPDGLVLENSVEAELINYAVFLKRRQELVEALKTLDPGSNASRDISRLIKEFDEQLAIDKGYIDNYLDTSTYVYLQEWLKDNEFNAKNYGTQRNFATKFILEQLGLTGSTAGFYRPMIEDAIDEWAKTNLDFKAESGGDGSLGETLDALEAIKNKYGDIRDELDEIFGLQKQENDLAEKQNKILEARKKLEEAKEEARKKAILDTLNAERKGEEENLTLEERRLAVEKARKALEDAKRQRTVRVIDASTGTFGARIESAPEVAKAEEDLSSAVDALNQYIEDQAWDSVIEAVDNGTTELSEIRNILRATLYGYTKDLSKAERDAIEAEILGAYEKGQSAEIDTSKIESAESSVTNAEKAYQEYLDQSLQRDVNMLLNSGKEISTTDLRVILKEYEKLGASKKALDAVSSSFLKYMNMTSEEFWGENENKSFWATVKNQMAEAMSKRSLIEEYGFPAIASQNGWLYEDGKKTPTPTPIYNTNNTGNVTQYFVNGVPVPVEAAQNMTIEEFCREYRLIAD